MSVSGPGRLARARRQAWIVALLLCLHIGCGAAILDHAALALQVAGSAGPLSQSEVALPYHWDRLLGAVDGSARFTLAFPVSAPSAPHAIFIPRIGNTFRVVLNGVVIGQLGTPGNRHQDFAKQAHFFRIPNQLLRRDNTLAIDINVQGGRNGGLSAVLVGPFDEVLAQYQARRRWQVTGVFAVAMVSAILGAMALLVWFRQRERLYLYYAASELLWVVYLSDALLEYTPLPWPWWGVIYFSAYAMSAVLIFNFSLRVMGLYRGVLKHASDWNLWLSVPVVLVGLLCHLPWVEHTWKIITDLVSLSIIVTVVRHGIRSPDLEKRMLAAGMLVVVLGGIRDDVVMVVLPYTKLAPAYAGDFGAMPWARYAWCVFAMSMAWIIAERMRKSALELAGMNLLLAQRLAQRETELTAIFSRQSGAARRQAMLEERQRITRDMHDGLGSQLLGVAHLAEDPAVTRAVLTRQLWETLDQLKLTVDAMQDTEGDIAALLGALRYRLGPRLASAGIELAWAVEVLPTVDNWTLQHSRDLQMIMFEAFSNLIAHAGASRASLHAASDGARRRIQITLHDNGHGFDSCDTDLARGHGMANMRARAAKLDSALSIISTGAGCSVILSVPLAQGQRTNH